MPPPRPPFAVDMRRTASREHAARPSTLVRITASHTASGVSANRPAGPVMPALLTSASSRPPNASSTAAKHRSRAAGSPTSARSANARAPASRAAAADA